DTMVNRQLATLADANGDAFLAALLEDFDQDARRSQNWTTALVAYATDRDPSMPVVLEGYRQRWDQAAIAGIEGLAPQSNRHRSRFGRPTSSMRRVVPRAGP
ncbi:MAG: hypothetical protein ACYCV7_15650, partial [Acidimicrobiales bacterium]